MTTVTGRLTDYGNNYDFRSALESKLNAKKSELGETELSLKRFTGSRLGSTVRGAVEGNGERLSSFKGRLGPVVAGRGRGNQQTTERRTSIGSRLGPRVSESIDDDPSNNTEGTNGCGGEVTGRGLVTSRIVVEQKTREDALAEQKMNNKKETQRNKRMFGSIVGTLQKFRADENKDKDRDLKKRKIEAKIDQKTEKEKEDAIQQKKELFDDKRKKEKEIMVLQVQMKRAEEFETWERSKRKQQKYIRTKKCSTKIYFLPKNHNDETLTALESTMDEIDQEIRVARELFEEELNKIYRRADQNPNASLEDLEGDDNSGDENETEGAVTKSVVSAIKNPYADSYTEKEKNLLESKECHITNVKKEDPDASNGHLEHGEANGTIDCKIEDSLTTKEENLTAEENNCPKSKKETTEILGQHVDAKETIEGTENKPENPKFAARDAIEKQSPGRSSVKGESNGDSNEISNPISPTNTNSMLTGEKPKNSEILPEKSFMEIKSQLKSPNAEKRKRNKSNSSAERQKYLSKSRIENNDTLLNRKKISSNTKVGPTRKLKGSKKRKRSSDESSSNSSSNEQSETDDKSSATNSSSDDSGSSDDSSSHSHDNKKVRKTRNKSVDNSKSRDKEKVKTKEHSNSQKHRSRKSRT